MPIPRIYQNIPLEENSIIEISPDASHYLGTVRRLKPGDSVVVFNGQKGEFNGSILKQNKHHIVIELKNHKSINPESPLNLILAQGIARGDKMDFIIQKAVELGVQKIIPLFTERCNVKLDAKKSAARQKHWQAIAISACEQSGRISVPEIFLPINLMEWIKDFNGTGIILSPHAKHSISELKLPVEKDIFLVVGPEGGLSEKEVEKFLQKNFISIKMGPRILRTETAPITAISILQNRFGDLS